jgi:hypothetical protein
MIFYSAHRKDEGRIGVSCFVVIQLEKFLRALYVCFLNLDGFFKVFL